MFSRPFREICEWVVAILCRCFPFPIFAISFKVLERIGGLFRLRLSSFIIGMTFSRRGRLFRFLASILIATSVGLSQLYQALPALERYISSVWHSGATRTIERAAVYHNIAAVSKCLYRSWLDHTRRVPVHLQCDDPHRWSRCCCRSPPPSLFCKASLLP